MRKRLASTNGKFYLEACATGGKRESYGIARNAIYSNLAPPFLQIHSMTRSTDDKTSTCGSCSYWQHDPTADGIHPTRLGWCNWISVPGWVLKKIGNAEDTRKMREDAGQDCWLHTKRDANDSSAPQPGE